MVYIHVPFCRSFCTYCDFYSEICRRHDTDAFEEYTQAVCREIASRKEQILATLDTDTVYIGGGTPSVLPPSFFESVVRELGGLGKDEFTVEVNPDDITSGGAAYVKSLLSSGVSRVSMGVQSLDDGMLKWMNRRHSAQAARDAYHILRDAGVMNISLDLIFGISHLSSGMLRDTLEEIIAMRPEHVSAYQLSIEDGSALAAMADDGRYVEADQEVCSGQYAIICRELAKAGYIHYEISNWALPGFEAVHNSAYWARKPYVGIGPGAHSFDGRRRTWNSQTLSGWTSEGETLTESEAREEEIMLGLRTAKGISPLLCSGQAVRGQMAQGRLVFTHDGNIRIPEDHFFVSDAIITEMI